MPPRTLIYIVSSGCKHEGASVDAVFDTAAAACAYAEKMVADHQALIDASNADLRDKIRASFAGESDRYKMFDSEAEAFESCGLSSWSVEDRVEGGPCCVASWGTMSEYVIIKEWVVNAELPRDHHDQPK